MNHPFIIVCRKELREMMRDKRVRSGAFVMPIAIIFMLMSIFGFLINTVGKAENTKVHIVKTESPLVALLKKSKFEIIEVATEDAGRQMIKDGAARLVLSFGPTQAGTRTEVKALLDNKEQTGQIAFAKVQAVFSEFNKASLHQYLASNHLSVDAEESVKLIRTEVLVGSKESTGELLVSLLPYLIVMWAFYGGMSIAGDLVAGEKDKATLETLLITPVNRTEIVVGKFLALASICLASSASTVIGLILVGLLKPPGTAELLKNGAGVTPTAMAIILLLMVPTVCLFASGLIAVSSYAKNPREAQTYMTSMSFLVVFPGIMSQFIGLTDFGRKIWINFIPILNTANNMRNALLGKVEILPLLITIGVSTVLATVALAFTIKLFNREEVLVRV